MSKKKQLKIAVVSSICGSYDEPREPITQSVPCDFYMFTDNPELVDRKNWKFKKIEWDYKHPRLNAKFAKMQAHKLLPDYDVYIWIDGSMEVTSPNYVQFWLDALEKDDVVFIKHWMKRDCVYQEMRAAKKLAKYADLYFSIKEQEKLYKSVGLPKHNGLYGCTSFAYKNTGNMCYLMDEWWSETLTQNYLDQHTLPFLLWDLQNFKPGVVLHKDWSKLFSLYHHNDKGGTV